MVEIPHLQLDHHLRKVLGSAQHAYIVDVTIHFTDHLITAEQQLIDAFTTLRQQNVTDLMLDVRYNGGGLLAIASEVAYMVAGPAFTAGQDFERLVFNDKHQAVNPVTGSPLTPMPFFDGSSSGQALPTLNLSRVYVLTGSMTCSASESIMNSLRGVGVQVIQIGSTTCGKPFGFADHLLIAGAFRERHPGGSIGDRLGMDVHVCGGC